MAFIWLVCLVAAMGGLLFGYDWVVISEIFPNRIRGAAMSVTVFSLWAGCTALTLTFPYLKAGLGAHGAFWLYGVICVVGFVVILLKLSETRGKSLEDIERELVN